MIYIYIYIIYIYMPKLSLVRGVLNHPMKLALIHWVKLAGMSDSVIWVIAGSTLREFWDIQISSLDLSHFVIPNLGCHIQFQGDSGHPCWGRLPLWKKKWIAHLQLRQAKQDVHVGCAGCSERRCTKHIICERQRVLLFVDGSNWLRTWKCRGKAQFPWFFQGWYFLLV